MKTQKCRFLGILVFVMCLNYSQSSFGQHFDFGYEYGFSSYFGDLAPFTAIPSMNKSASSKGYYVGYGNAYGTIFLNYTTSELYADDRNAQDINRVKRNLNFRSPLFEYGLTAEINTAAFFFKRYTRLQPLVITGINVFYFNPTTVFEGEVIELQPLATEGQGTIAKPGSEKYKLTQISIPIGAGLKYEISDKLWIGVGAKLRLTFTDYLDDVSATYIDPEILAQSNGTLSAQVAFRGDELDPNSDVIIGKKRGNADENDWYMTTYVTLGLRFREEKTRKRKRRKKRGRRNKIYCPTF